MKGRFGSNIRFERHLAAPFKSSRIKTKVPAMHCDSGGVVKLAGGCEPPWLLDPPAATVFASIYFFLRREGSPALHAPTYITQLRAPPPFPPLRTCRGYCGRASPLCLLMGRDKTHLKHRRATSSSSLSMPTSPEGTSGHTPSTSVNESGTKERRFTVNDALNAVNADDLHLFSKYELVEELRSRHLPCSGPKKQLIRTLLDDNANRRGAEGTVETLTSVSETRNEQQARIEELSTANDKLQADVERLQAEMQRLIQAVSLTKASDVPKDVATAPSNGPTVQRLEPSDIPARPTPTQSNVIVPEVPPQTSTPHENERHEITHLLGMIVETQARISEASCFDAGLIPGSPLS
ncbi:hypothetical protein ISCGN_003651 [Ixodes scapularis]